ncbi:MAG: hypothetical protein M3321_03940 [Actinomycetota bacterium]|nr:hypothetical protein [Actinomycetota bacterium]
MALDIYVGTLSRYYARDWQTPGERAAAELGIAHETVFEHPPEEGVTDPAEIRSAVLAWRQALAEELGVVLDWSERDDAPWFSERPAWDGWTALLLHAAYEERPELERPAAVADDALDRDPAWLAVTGQRRGLRRFFGRKDDTPSETRYDVLYYPELWLPGVSSVVYAVLDTAGNEIALGGVEALLAALEDLNERTFALGEPEIDHHRRNAEDVDALFEAKARWGLGTALWCAARAAEHRLPMKLDY